MRRRRWIPIVAALAVAGAVAVLGNSVTELGPWYRSLRKPAWQPPDALFGPVWTLIFACAAMSGYLAWMRATSAAKRQQILALFLVNAILNVGWSLLFFRLQRPDWALIEVAFLWLSIVALIVAIAPLSRLAAWLLAPYLAWVAFAAVLNFAIVRLNGPFG